MVRAIRFLQTLLISVSLFAGSMAFADYQPQKTAHKAVLEGGDGGGSFPWPWSLAIPFPWKDIQGVWRAEKSGRVFYFGFRRVTTNGIENRLAVKQFDNEECDLMATGVGFDNGKSVVAQMNTNYGQIYRLSLVAFNQEDAPEPPLTNHLSSDHVMVVQISLLGQQTTDWTMQMVKVSSGLEFKCTDPEKKLKF